MTFRNAHTHAHKHTYYTSAKTFTKRIPVGMGAANSNETSERPMTSVMDASSLGTPLLCLQSPGKEKEVAFAWRSNHFR